MNPTIIRFTNYAPYDRLRIATSPGNTCIFFISTVPSARRAPNRSLRCPLLEERNARFTHPILFLQCYSVFLCITRQSTIPKPLCHSVPIAGEADHLPPILSFSPLLSCTHTLTPSAFCLFFTTPFYSIFLGVSPAIAPSAPNTGRYSHKYIFPTFSYPSIELQGMRRRRCNE